jgi:hypothetical protein
MDDLIRAAHGSALKIGAVRSVRRGWMLARFGTSCWSLSATKSVTQCFRLSIASGAGSAGRCSSLPAMSSSKLSRRSKRFSTAARRCTYLPQGPLSVDLPLIMGGRHDSLCVRASALSVVAGAYTLTIDNDRCCDL